MPSKLCPQVIAFSNEVVRFVAAGCPVVKLVAGWEIAAELQALRSDLIIIGKIEDDWSLSQVARGDSTPQTAAHLFIERQEDIYRRYRQ